MLSDLRHAARALWRARGFTAVTVLTLSLGIGAAASIFSVVDWVLFRSREYPQDVYLIGGEVAGDSQFRPGGFPFQADVWEQQTQLFSSTARATYKSGNIALTSEPVGTQWQAVTADVLPLLGIAPAFGRGFRPDECKPGANHVVILSHHFWQQRFGGRADVLGQTLTLGDQVCEVVGVLRPAQVFPPYFYAEVYQAWGETTDPAQPWLPFTMFLGRLQPGVTPATAVTALEQANEAAPPQLANYLRTLRPALRSVADLNALARPEVYWVLLAAVALLYAIACVNASNLILVRMLGQRRDLSVRLALGGGRWRIIRLLGCESGLLVGLAAAGGVIVANWMMPILLQVSGAWGTRSVSLFTWSLNDRVLVVLVGLTLITGVLVTIIPALRVLGASITAGLKDGGAALGESRGLARLRSAFVVVQATLAVILLTGAGLMVRTFQNLQHLDLGFDPAGRIIVQTALPADFPTEREARAARLREVMDELRRVPGVQDVGLGSNLLLPGFFNATNRLRRADGEIIEANMNEIMRGSQDAIGLTLRRGHWPDQFMGNEVMVNETLAHLYWPNGDDPVGQFLEPEDRGARPDTDWKGWLVVGVFGDIRRSMREPADAMILGPEGWGVPGMSTFVLRTRDGLDGAAQAQLRRQLYAYNPKLVVTQLRSADDVRDQQLWIERLAHAVLRILAGIALLLTLVGLFSVVAYTVDRRMNEFGVRLALGATPRHLVELVLRRGVLLTALGLAIGSAGALALTRFIQSLLFETPAHDPLVLCAVAAALLLAAVAASLLPARRAARVDISRLLRSE